MCRDPLKPALRRKASAAWIVLAIGVGIAVLAWRCQQSLGLVRQDRDGGYVLRLGSRHLGVSAGVGPAAERAGAAGQPRRLVATLGLSLSLPFPAGAADDATAPLATPLSNAMKAPPRRSACEVAVPAPGASSARGPGALTALLPHQRPLP